MSSSILHSGCIGRGKVVLSCQACHNEIYPACVMSILLLCGDVTMIAVSVSFVRQLLHLGDYHVLTIPVD
jgi:hypothetical protein